MNLALTYDHRLIDGCASLESLGHVCSGCGSPLAVCLAAGRAVCPADGACLLPARCQTQLPCWRLLSASAAHHCVFMGPATAPGNQLAAHLHSPSTHPTFSCPACCRREAVTFLKRIKEIVEDPRRLLLDV